MSFFQKEIELKPFSRGFHLITRAIRAHLPDLRIYQVGMLNVFIQHTSASLCINENADPSVRTDFESHFNVMVPENAPYYIHTYEGPDDMPAHIKAALLGASISIPIRQADLALGTWQGIYLAEHRDQAPARRLILTIWGEA